MSRPVLPSPRGALTDWLFAALVGPPHHLASGPPPSGEPLTCDDEALALYVCYELHYRGFDRVSEDWEWEPSLLSFRATLERRFLSSVMASVPEDRVPRGRSSTPGRNPGPQDVADALDAILARPAPSLSRFMAEHGTRGQFREFATHRSAYQLKEADPHTWAIPRLDGQAKAALVAIQKDEYGDGDAQQVHAELFTRTLQALGLSPAYGAYLDAIPGITLSTVNLISLFGLHRRWRGALVGHLAIFEMASVGPNTNYVRSLRRLGYGTAATTFYDVHVVADELHQRIARDDMAAQLAHDDPTVARDVIFGAEAVTTVERMFTDHLLGAWASGKTSLCADLATAARAS